MVENKALFCRAEVRVLFCKVIVSVVGSATSSVVNGDKATWDCENIDDRIVEGLANAKMI